MARATFFSDFKLLVDTVLRRWDTSVMEDLMGGAILAEDSDGARSRDDPHARIDSDWGR